MRWVACFLGLLALATGCILEDKPVDPQFDGGVEAGMCIVCPPVRPVCNDELRSASSAPPSTTTTASETST